MQTFGTDLLIPFARAIENMRTCSAVSARTVDIIRMISSSYLVDSNTPVAKSKNAGCGRLLSRHRKSLGIELLGSCKVIDDKGTPSTSASWLIVPYQQEVNRCSI